MVYSAEQLENKLREKLEATHVKIEDISDGCGMKFSAIIVSPLFEAKGLLQQQRLVNDALKEELQSIHAFTQKTFSPTQWEKAQAS